jgi:predicted TIM-barrel fold metal-dependent hydrolase
MRMPLPTLGDPEGARLPEGLPAVVDGHVHLFPDRIFRAIWRWFDNYGWPVRYKLQTPDVLDFLFSRGVTRVVALHYAHAPGIARMMNAFMAEVMRAEPRVVGVATVLPGEPDAVDIVKEGFALGLRGVKLHCHVQCFSPDDERALFPIYELCEREGKPLVIHAGREPASDALKCNPHEICSAERTARVLRAFPKLTMVVPHLGADEFAAYEILLERHDNLYLDTTMMLADYFPELPSFTRLLAARPDRIYYGTDFPNLPYAWDREIIRLAKSVPDAVLPALLSGTVNALFP